MPHKVLVYADALTATGSVVPSLRESFNGRAFDVSLIRAQDILDGALRDPEARVLVLPGIVGEISPYTDQLTTAALVEIRDFIDGKPNAMLTICAGSYFVSRQTVYTPPWAPPRGRFSAVPLFNGLACGPVSSYARNVTDRSRFDDVITVPVNFKNTDGSWERTKACYGNGPALYPDCPDDPAIEILATYAEIPGTPAAMLRRSFGQGALYMSCILPEIGYQHIAPSSQFESAQRLMADLKDDEPGRRRLWDSLTARMKQDLNA